MAHWGGFFYIANGYLFFNWKTCAGDESIGMKCVTSDGFLLGYSGLDSQVLGF